MKKSLFACLALLMTFTARSQSLQDSLELEAFMDGVIQSHLRDKPIAGATVSIIKNGKILFAKGYGFANLKINEPVKADSTLFRIGSISKMFTWISVMQLVSQGKLKLDEDINHYLKGFKIPETYPQPITLKDLMTHTPGFEDRFIGLFARDSGSLRPLGEILSGELPVRVRPPGIFASYSNHGAGLAAYIVEQTSDMSFNDYVEKNILRPLQMNMTTFRQPLPEALKPMMSEGYKYARGEFIEEPFEYVPLYPVGAASSSATDMVRFMSAILNNGRLDGVQMLDSVTLRFMESPAHRHHPSVNPMRYGFMDISRNGVTVIGHGGDTFWFHSLMALLPDHDIGLFISFNSDKGSGTYMDVLDQFMDRYFPEKNPLRVPLKIDKKVLERFTGAYRVNRHAYHDITAIASLFGDITITIADSALRVVSGEKVKQYVPIDSLVFREEYSSEIIAFKQNEKGQITQMFQGNLPIVAFDKVTVFSDARIHNTIFFVVASITLIMLFYWPITGRARWGYQHVGLKLPLPMWSKIVAWFTYFLLAAFYAGLVISLGDPTSIVFGVPASLKIVLILPFIMVLMLLLMFMNLYQLLGKRRYQFWSRLFYLLITIAGAAAVWQMYYWNFLGFDH